MIYKGKLYGKMGSRYFPMENDTNYYDEIEKKLENLTEHNKRMVDHLVGTQDTVPELYEALEGLLNRASEEYMMHWASDGFDEDNDGKFAEPTFTAAREALKKARGEK